MYGEMKHSTDLLDKWHMNWLRMLYKKSHRDELLDPPSQFAGAARDLNFTPSINLSGLAHVNRCRDVGRSHRPNLPPSCRTSVKQRHTAVRALQVVVVSRQYHIQKRGQVAKSSIHSNGVTFLRYGLHLRSLRTEMGGKAWACQVTN